VVDNIETAQKCVQALKQNQVGQATFIALDKASAASAQNIICEAVKGLFVK